MNTAPAAPHRTPSRLRSSSSSSSSRPVSGELHEQQRETERGDETRDACVCCRIRAGRRPESERRAE